MSITETVTPLITPAIEALGIELYDIEYLKEGGDFILRLYIDKEGGVDLNACEAVSTAASAVLDEHDPISAAYLLEVSSPGIERKLVKDSHFARYIGHKVKIKLFAPLDNRKAFTGVLSAYDDGVITLTDENNQARQFDKSKVAICRLVVFD
jgi:ribosome maturation factor RimP